MVVIETASEEDTSTRSDGKKEVAERDGDQKASISRRENETPKHFQAGTHLDSITKDVSSMNLRHSKQEEDDWETASEGEEDGGDHGHSQNPKSHESFEDAMTEEEQKQRALSQANASKSEGNNFYASGKYGEALVCYKNALEVAPQDECGNEIRAMCYSNSAICHLQLNQYKEAIEQSTNAVELNPTYVKAFIRRAQGHEKLDQLEEALTDYKKVIELDPGNQQAIMNVRRLEPIVAQRREKLKEEMLGKLKDIGNSLLGRFGLSVDNFKTVQDPNTGSYSISFQR